MGNLFLLNTMLQVFQLMMMQNIVVINFVYNSELEYFLQLS